MKNIYEKMLILLMSSLGIMVLYKLDPKFLFKDRLIKNKTAL